MTFREAEPLVDGPPLRPIDRLLRRWRFSKAKPFIKLGDRVLDVGCFDGALFHYLGSRVSDGVGIDPALRRPVERPRYRLIPGALSEQVVGEGRFDVVTMFAVLEHVAQSELGRVTHICAHALREGGRVIVTVPSPKVDHILNVLQRLRLVSGIGLHQHHGFEPSSVPSLFKGHGFRLVTARTFQMGLNHLYVLERAHGRR